MTSDGPAGVRILKECEVYTTAFPCSTQLACSWNRELAFKAGVKRAWDYFQKANAISLTPHDFQETGNHGVFFIIDLFGKNHLTEILGTVEIRGGGGAGIPGKIMGLLSLVAAFVAVGLYDGSGL